MSATLAPSTVAAKHLIPFPACSICPNKTDIVTNPFGRIDLSQSSSIDPSIASMFRACDNIAYFGSHHEISQHVCAELHQAGISEMCSCRTLDTGASTCGLAKPLTLGQSTLTMITDTNDTIIMAPSQGDVCVIDSPSAWFRVNGTAMDVCKFSFDFVPKLSVFLEGAEGQCNNLTCVGGVNHFLNKPCFFTFPSKLNQGYFLVVSGTYGNVGPFELTFSDQTGPPSVAPSTYPSAATMVPFATPIFTANPAFKSTPKSVPPATLSSSPTHSPLLSPYPNCFVCGNPGERVSATISATLCQELEIDGLTGAIEPNVCAIVQGLTKDCGCRIPAENDICSGAIAIAVGQSLNGSLINSTLDNEKLCPENEYGPGVWYKLIGTGGTLKAFSSFLASKNPFVSLPQAPFLISVFVGSDCSALQCAGANVVSNSVGGLSTFKTTKGASYFLMVQAPTDAGDFELTVSDDIAPANDACSNAIPLVFGQNVSGTYNDATVDDIPTCRNPRTANTTVGVWYRIKSGKTPGIQVAASTCTSANQDFASATDISVFTGSCDKLECVEGVQKYCWGGRVVWTTEESTDYFVFVSRDLKNVRMSNI